jgi:IclR family KDG regulon transcriptional repressor
MPRISGSPRGSGVQAVVFALEILELLAQRQAAVGVTELAKAFDTTKSRMHRHLQTLLAAGYIIREEDTERYKVSTRLIALGRAVSDNFELTSVARPVMRELREHLGNPVVLSQAEPDGVHILAMLTGKSALEIGVKVGSVIDFHSTAQGKVALAFGEKETHDRVLAGPLEPHTDDTITDPALLAAEIDQIRARGWASAANQTTIGLNALAAPILDGGGRLAGIIAIVDSVQYIPEPPTAEQTAAVTRAGREISRLLGYRPT